MKRSLSQWVVEKRRWHETPSEAERELGFTGWRSRGYLPHFDLPGVIQFITYRLADALPAERRHEWEGFCRIQDQRERFLKIEAHADRGHGECLLRYPRFAALVEENLLHLDGERYRLLSWCVMPNHVHVIVEVGQTPLAKLLHGWKSYTSKRVNEILERSDPFWQQEYFDRYIRDDDHLRRTMRYVENNPVKAGLCASPADWRWSSARRSAGGPPASVEGKAHRSGNIPQA